MVRVVAKNNSQLHGHVHAHVHRRQPIPIRIKASSRVKDIDRYDSKLVHQRYPGVSACRANPRGSGEEYDEYDFEEEDTDYEIDKTFEGVKITVEDRNAMMWTDYLAASVGASKLTEIQEEDRVLGIETSISPAAQAQYSQEQDVLPSAAEQENDGASFNTVATPIVDPLLRAASASKLFDGDRLQLVHDQGPLTEWDLRAAMEKRRRLEQDREKWLERKSKRVGKYRAIASDWRNDVRVKDTGDPSQPQYREWTLKEIWDLITLGGVSVDPRTLPYKVDSPDAYTDFVAEGFYQHPEVPEFLAMQGRLIEEQDEPDVLDPDAEALLASEFSDFDDFDAQLTSESTIDEF